MPFPEDEIVRIVRRHHPEAQALYLFGSQASGEEAPESDVDLALLLPPVVAKREGLLTFKECRFALEELLCRPADLINLRGAQTVFQNEILQSGRLLFDGDTREREAFEGLVLSQYVRLNEERAEILDEIRASGRIVE